MVQRDGGTDDDANDELPRSGDAKYKGSSSTQMRWLSMAREFISDYTVTISRDRIVVPELVEKSTFLSRVRNELFKN